MADRDSSQFEPTVKFEPEQERTVPFRRLEPQQTMQFDRSQRPPPPPEPSKGKLPLLLGGLLLALCIIGLGIYLLSSGDTVPAETTQPTDVPTNAAASTGATATAGGDSSPPTGLTLESNGVMPSTAAVSPELFDVPAPNGTTFVSDIYTIDRDGAQDGVVQIDIPADAGDTRTIDLVELTEDGWRVRPSIVRTNLIETDGDFAPAFALVQSPQGAVQFAAERSPDTVLPNILGELFGERSIGPFSFQDDGLLTTSVPSVPLDGLYYLHVVNRTEEGVDENATLSLMINPDVQKSHITTLIELASSKQYDGVHIDYQQIPDDMRDSFTTFLRELQNELEANDLALVVTLQYPVLSAGLWDTAGQNWPEIGALATVLFAEMPIDPTVYPDNEEAEQFVEWATRQVDRRKLMLSYTANGTDLADTVFTSLPNSTLIREFGSLNGRIDDDQVIVRLNGSANDLVWDGFAVTYKFDWKDAGKTHTVWLANEAVLAYRMRFSNAYGVRGVTLRDLGDEQNTLGYRAALDSVSGDVELPAATASAIIWSVAKSDGSLVASGTAEGDDPTRFAWFTEGRGGLYSITADFFIGDQAYLLGEYVADLGEGNGTEFEALPSDTPTPETEDESSAESSNEESSDEESDTETVETVRGTTIGRLNFRAAPSTSAQQIALLLPNTPLELIGRSADNLWYNVRIEFDTDDVREGWVWAEFANVNRNQAEALPVTE